MDLMKFRIGYIVISCLGVFCLSSPAEADLSSFFRRLTSNAPQVPHPAIVQIQVQEQDAWARGSGTLIAANEQYGWVITNWHVVRGGNGTAFVTFPGGHQTQGHVVKTDEIWDLAMIVIPRPPAQPIPLASSVPAIGEPLTIAGYGSGEYRAARGRCTNYAAPDTRHPQEMIDVSVAARQGDSGGPILNDRSELAGVLFGAGQGATTGTHVGRVRMFLLSPGPSTEQIAAGREHQVVPPRQTASARVQPLPLPSDPGSGSTVPVPAQVTGFQQPLPGSTPPTSTTVIDPAPASTYVAGGAPSNDPFAEVESQEVATSQTPAAATAILSKPEFETVESAVPTTPASSSDRSQVEAKMQCDPKSGVCRLVPRSKLENPTVVGDSTQQVAVESQTESNLASTEQPSSPRAAIDPNARPRKLDDTSTFLLFVGAVGAFVYFAPRHSESGVKPKKPTKKPPKKRKVVVIEDDEDEDEEDE